MSYNIHLTNNTNKPQAYYTTIGKQKYLRIVHPAKYGVSTHEVIPVTGKREACKLAAEKGYTFIN